MKACFDWPSVFRELNIIVIYMFVTQPTIYRLIANFSLYHELVTDRSIVLDITWDYTMAWYPAQKISEL